MKCPKCKKQLRENAKFCPNCGTRIQKRAGRRIISVILIVALLLGIIATGLAAGMLIARYSSSGKSLFDFFDSESKVQISSAEEAIEHAKKLGEEYGYENALSELTEKSTTTIDGDSYYRLQQNYNGIPVYGKAIVYATDKDGTVISITGNVMDIDSSMNLMQTISHADATDYAKRYIANEMNIDDLEKYSVSDKNDDLCIFYSEEDEKLYLAYRVSLTCYIDTIDQYELFVDAHTGDVLLANTSLGDASAIGYRASDTSQQNGFTVKQLDDGQYALVNEEYGLWVYDLNRINSSKQLVARNLYVVSDNNIFGDDPKTESTQEVAVDLFVNVESIHKYYNSLVNFETTTGSILLYYNDSYRFGKNARGGINTDTLDGVLSVGHTTGTNDIDVLAHEYGHIMSYTKVGWNLNNVETKAINEGLSDIFGEIAEAHFFAWNKPDWIMIGDNIDVKRSIQDPESTDFADNIEDSPIWDVYIWSKTEDYYFYSTAISHSAYLMWNGIDGVQNKKIDIDSLATLWYRAMLMMPSDCDFRECRQLVELAATSMELTTDQLACISEAFDTVGIKGTSQSDDSRLVLFTTSGKTAVKGTVYEIKTVDGIEKSLPISAATVAVYSHNSNKVCEVLDMADADGFFEVALSDGSYSVSVSADGYIGETITFELEENEVRYLSIALEPQNNGTENDFGAYNTYLSAANKTIESGSWSEYLIMIADLAITDGSAKTKTKVTLTSDADVSNYSESNLSQIRMSGSAEMTVMGQTYAWNMEYENGTAHYRYTKPNQTSADMKIDPSFFNFGTMTSDMMSNAKMSGNKITFTVPGEKITEVGIAAVNQMSGVDDLKYGDVGVIVMISAEGTIDTITMTFHASMKYQGYDADVDYDISYSFSQNHTRPNSDSISEKLLTQVNIYENGRLYAEDHYSYNEEGLISEVIRNYTTDDGYGYTMLTTELQYDSEQRLVYRVYYNENSGTASFISYNYDSEGKLSDYYNKTGINFTATCEYGSSDRLIKEVRTYPTGEPTVLEYEYDNQNHLIEIKQTEESGVSYVNFFYDSNGRLSKSTYGWPYGEQYEYEYCYDYKFFEIITSLYFEKYTSANILDVMGHEIYGYAFTSPEYTADSDGYLVKVTDNAENRIYDFQYSN